MIKNFLTWLKESSTHPRIVSFFKLGLTKWFKDQEYIWQKSSDIFSDCTSVNKALSSHFHIGWYHLLCGMISDDLLIIQQQSYQDISILKSSGR